RVFCGSPGVLVGRSPASSLFPCHPACPELRKQRSLPAELWRVARLSLAHGLRAPAHAADAWIFSILLYAEGKPFYKSIAHGEQTRPRPRHCEFPPLRDRPFIYSHSVHDT